MSTRVYTYTYKDNVRGPALVDFDFWIGSTVPPVIFGPKNVGGSPFPTAGSEFTLKIKWPGDFIEKTTAKNDGEFVLDEKTSKLTWTPTLEESLKIPLGRTATYLITRITEIYQQPFIVGFITGKDGINNV